MTESSAEQTAVPFSNVRVLVKRLPSNMSVSTPSQPELKMEVYDDDASPTSPDTPATSSNAPAASSGALQMIQTEYQWKLFVKKEEETELTRIQT